MPLVSAAGKKAAASSLILGESAFKRTIRRERKRTERSGLAMVLLLIGTQDCPGENKSALLSEIAKAISAVKSDIDILGWFEPESLIGVIFPEIKNVDLADACVQIEARIQRAIASRLAEGGLVDRLEVRLRVYPEPQLVGEENVQLSSVDPFLYPELHASYQTTNVFRCLKRGLDILISIILLVLLFPLLLLIAALVKLSSGGPVIFRQMRIGQMMKPFMICKFRTMYADVDHRIHSDYVSWFINSSAQGKEGKDQDTVFKLTNDPRITQIGHFLRKTSLDELPQLWNVLCGEMSLVGPRPPLWYELKQYKPWHRHRILDAKPGITGLWQVTGRSRTTFDDMVRLDLRYARGCSLLTDVKILLATPLAVIKGKGAC